MPIGSAKQEASRKDQKIEPESVLKAELRTLESCTSHLEATNAELQRLATAAPWRRNGYFDAQQQDEIENLLFRFLACRNALWHLANQHRDDVIRYPSDVAQAKNSVIAFSAGFQLVLCDVSFVTAFRGDPIAIAMLNENFYRSKIPAKTYDRLLLGVTNESQLKALRDSFLLFSEELAESNSPLAAVINQAGVYRKLAENARSVAAQADKLVQGLVDSESRFLPEIDNDLRHTRIVALVNKSENGADELLSIARAHLFKGISRIKNPEAHLISFSAEQKRQVLDLLQPGDIILTYTAGYISDIFIPGKFKHAITYIGSVEDRLNAGLSANRLGWVPDIERDRLLQSIATTHITSGEKADVIEAVGEGVIFNNLSRIMDTHTNRMLVLRPVVNHDEHSKALAEVFRFLGDGYDFRFDFADASEQVCTEVVYRALNGKGLINFTLVERAGHPTLSADDIANNYLASQQARTFEFVLLAEERPDSTGHNAEILLNDVGSKRLVNLMDGP